MRLKVPLIPITLNIQIEKTSRARKAVRKQITLKQMMIVIAALSIPMWYGMFLKRTAEAQREKSAALRKKLFTPRVLPRVPAPQGAGRGPSVVPAFPPGGPVSE